MPQRKQTGPREPREESSKPMRIIRNEKQVKWVKGAQRKELVNGVDVKANKPSKIKDMVIGLGKLKRCSKSPWECKNGMGPRMPKGMKRVEDTQKNDRGQGSPRWHED